MHLLNSITPNKERLFPYTAVRDRYFGAFAKLRKATISFVMHICPFIHPANRGSILDSGKTLSPALERPNRRRPPYSLLLSRYWRLCPWIQEPERVSDHSQPSSDKLKNEWSYNSSLYTLTTCTKTALLFLPFINQSVRTKIFSSEI